MTEKKKFNEETIKKILQNNPHLNKEEVIFELQRWS